jgi:hypothetical protein
MAEGQYGPGHDVTCRDMARYGEIWRDIARYSETRRDARPDGRRRPAARFCPPGSALLAPLLALEPLHSCEALHARKTLHARKPSDDQTPPCPGSSRFHGSLMPYGPMKSAKTPQATGYITLCPATSFPGEAPANPVSMIMGRYCHISARTTHDHESDTLSRYPEMRNFRFYFRIIEARCLDEKRVRTRMTHDLESRVPQILAAFWPHGCDRKGEGSGPSVEPKNDPGGLFAMRRG